MKKLLDWMIGVDELVVGWMDKHEKEMDAISTSLMLIGVGIVAIVACVGLVMLLLLLIGAAIT